MIATKARVDPKQHQARRWTFDELAAALPESNLPTELWDGELIMSLAPSLLYLVAGRYQLVGRWRPQEQAHSRLLEGFSLSVGTLFG